MYKKILLSIITKYKYIKMQAIREFFRKKSAQKKRNREISTHASPVRPRREYASNTSSEKTITPAETMQLGTTMLLGRTIKSPSDIYEKIYTANLVTSNGELNHHASLPYPSRSEQENHNIHGKELGRFTINTHFSPFHIAIMPTEEHSMSLPSTGQTEKHRVCFFFERPTHETTDQYKELHQHETIEFVTNLMDSIPSTCDVRGKFPKNNIYKCPEDAIMYIEGSPHNIKIAINKILKKVHKEANKYQTIKLKDAIPLRQKKLTNGVSTGQDPKTPDASFGGVTASIMWSILCDAARNVGGLRENGMPTLPFLIGLKEKHLIIQNELEISTNKWLREHPEPEKVIE